MFTLFFVVVRKGYCLPTSYQNVGVVSLIPTCLQSFIHPSILVREFHNIHIHIVLCCGVKTVLFSNKLSECWCHIINPYLFTKFHTSKHLGKRVTQTCMFTLFFVVVRKRYCLPTSYRRISIPYLFTKFHASKHFGKRVTQTCMPYCNVWAKVVYCGSKK